MMCQLMFCSKGISLFPFPGKSQSGKSFIAKNSVKLFLFRIITLITNCLFLI